MPLSAYQHAMETLYSARLAHVSTDPTQLLYEGAEDLRMK